MPWRLLLRQQRIGLIAMSYFGIVYALVNSAGFPYFAGRTAAAQAVFGSQMQSLAAQLAWLLPQPIAPGTVAGYVQWRVYGFLVIVFAAWALLGGAGATRGDEERGLVEVWLAASVARARYLTFRFTTFALASATAVTLAGLAAWAGSLVDGAVLPPVGVLMTSVSLWALTLACYAISIAVAQLMTTFRGAAGLAGAVLLGLILLDSLRRSSPAPPAVTAVSVFSLNDRTTAIAPGGAVDGAAIAILFAVVVGALVTA
ncbi:MAG TPA: hypothetical protein VFA70_03155, partial [Dehalococcoidia bacterium]|nr:hypothetical protein [Dehalococcoidia bacterium]